MKPIEKIKKLLKLSKSPNVHEAALALSRAKELMAKYKITEKDVAISEIKEAVAKGSQSRGVPSWLNALATTVAEVFQCRHFWEETICRSQYRIVSNCVFVGYDPHCEVAKYAFEVAHRKLAKARREHIKKLHNNTKRSNKIAKGDAFALGWVYGIRQKLETLVPPPQEGNGIDLMIIDQLTAYIDDKTNKESTIQRKTDDRSANAGYLRGRMEGINKGVAVPKNKLIH